MDIASFDFQQCKSKLEDELSITKVIVVDKVEGALQCEVLFKEVEEEFEIVGLKLVKVEWDS
jgi:hypothetical protein